LIVSAVLAGLACLFLVVLDAHRPRQRGFASARIFVAGAWALCWLAYGVNVTRLPQPEWRTLLLLAVACFGSLLMIPSPSGQAPSPQRWVVGRTSRIVTGILVTMMLFLIVWDVVHLVMRVSEHGWSIALKIHRMDRSLETGSFGLPGIEILRAIGCATGILGFARWSVGRRGLDLAVAAFGGVVASLGTGRWDVTNYAIWLFLVAAFLGRQVADRRWNLRAAAFVVVLGVMFVGHGQIFGKNDFAAYLAGLPEAERIQAAGSVLIPSTKGRSGVRRSAARQSPGPQRICDRWKSVTASNEQFKSLPPAATSVLLYAAGPFAAFDHDLCIPPDLVRQVIFYWPLKALRVAAGWDEEFALMADPFVDIGVPFNNYSVMYSFLNELGPWLGPILWLVVAVIVRGFSSTMAATGHPALIVAAAAPLSMAGRTPWSNTYFDGTLCVWIAVALITWWAADRDRRLVPDAPR
jgi:hypothetical protein